MKYILEVCSLYSFTHIKICLFFLHLFTDWFCKDISSLVRNIAVKVQCYKAASKHSAICYSRIYFIRTKDLFENAVDYTCSTDFTFPLARWAPMQPATTDPTLNLHTRYPLWLKWTQAVWNVKFTRHFYTWPVLGIEPQAFWHWVQCPIHLVMCFWRWVMCWIEGCLTPLYTWSEGGLKPTLLDNSISHFSSLCRT